MNMQLSDRAKAAIERINALRVIEKESGLRTKREQFAILMSLSNEDAIAVATATGNVGTAKLGGVQ